MFIGIRTWDPWPHRIYEVHFSPHYLVASYAESIKNKARIIGQVQNQAL